MSRAHSFRTTRPPWIAERLLLRILPAEHRTPVVGDLAEEYTEIAATSGSFRADAWYWRQALGSIPPLVARRLARASRPQRKREGESRMSELLQDLRYSLRALQ